MSEGQKHLLIVDDEHALREAIAERLADHGFLVEQAASGEQALQRLADFAFDILVTDLRLPGIDGGKVIDAALERYPEIIAIVITGYGTVKDAVEAIKQGAADFIEAVPVRRAAARAAIGARTAPPQIGKRVPAVATRGSLSHRRPGRQQPRDA